jgi:hypothetical protein
MPPAVPRLRHVLPKGPVVRAHRPIPVVALVPWHDGRRTTEDAEAIAWTGTEVLIAWTTPWGTPHQVWLPAEHVNRRGPDPAA